ncbi:hypothetical protein [Tuwongella immobilis]|uniref:Uncharacterized protein n=1 Tax=Tuwongella immobilis TaxID=692036 RepID=A0A6C2YS65_9BACT|nr:hypothetical protein [Tuwongella immobilis]VIP03973.1 Uncharacterized protein OS=Streptomyces scabiei GN=IQ61_15300 PE=4 SV=1 [Tuwongella immobilis]VTS05313.1 Uncharacterized protein OS=Streptomyces scabiei GN=IQ61_15300 PE=4 SV=1 [Tuwongella immobilis]
MAQRITGKLRVIGSWDFSDDTAPGGVTANTGSIDQTINLTAGTSAGQVNRVLARANGFTIAAGGSTTIDLGGTLKDFVGNSNTITKVKMVVLQLDSANLARSVLIGPHTTNGFDSWLGTTDGSVRVKKGGMFALGCTDADGYSANSSTENLLAITNEDTVNPAIYKLIIEGVG